MNRPAKSGSDPGRRTYPAGAAGAPRPPGLRMIAVALLALAAAARSSPAGGQQTGTPVDTSFTALELGDNADFPGGKLAVVDGEAGPRGRRFRLGDLSVMQPVLAYVVARDHDADLHMTMVKPGKTEPSLTGSTQGVGYATLSTRTWGGLDILVESPDPTTRFALIVWVSDELKPDLGDVVVTPAQFKVWAAARPTGSLPPALAEAAREAQPDASSGGGSRSSTLFLVLGAFVAGGMLVLVTVLVMRRQHG